MAGPSISALTLALYHEARNKPQRARASHHPAQVGGTAVSPDGATLAVFHRAERLWTDQSYSGDLFQHMTNTTSISHETVMLVDRLTGSVTAQWGACRN